MLVQLFISIIVVLTFTVIGLEGNFLIIMCIVFLAVSCVTVEEWAKFYVFIRNKVNNKFFKTVLVNFYILPLPNNRLISDFTDWGKWFELECVISRAELQNQYYLGKSRKPFRKILEF